MLKLLFKKQPVEYPSDSISAAVTKAMTTHRAAVRDFETAIDKLLRSHDTLLDEVAKLREEKDKGNAN